MLANDPAVILADEPTGNLDPETSKQIIGFLEEFNTEGRTIVMVTHDPRAARRAKRSLKLANGTIVSENVVDVSVKLTEDEEDALDAA
jgi:putative ABC transport system ATP-binding protein